MVSYYHLSTFSSCRFLNLCAGNVIIPLTSDLSFSETCCLCGLASSCDYVCSYSGNEIQSGECEGCYCSSGTVWCYFCSLQITAPHPGPSLVSRLSSTHSWGIPLSATRRHSHALPPWHNRMSGTRSRMETCISAHCRTYSGQAGLAAIVDRACGEIFTEHAEPICGCSSAMGGSWLCVTMFVCMFACELAPLHYSQGRNWKEKYLGVWVMDQTQNEG